MKRSWRIALLSLAGFTLLFGITRLRFATEIFGLLPPDAPGVRALRLWDRHFSGAHALTLTVSAEDETTATLAARQIAEGLRPLSNRVDRVLWQPVWRDDPLHGAGFVAWQWLNQTETETAALESRLDSARLKDTLSEARETLKFSLSPEEIARLAYDPLGLNELPGKSSRLAEEFRRGESGFSSVDGRFRILTLHPPRPLRGFKEAAAWQSQIRAEVDLLRSNAPALDRVRIRYTGGPAIAAETSRDMESDMRGSVGGTALLVAGMFALAHRRLLPLLWMQALLGLVLILTLGLAGWLLGSLNVISLGFASILLGLVDDFGLVLYQEMLAAPHRCLAEIRKEHSRPILASAGTTAAAFLLLNLSGVPGLAQLGTLVAVGTLIAAVVMLGFFLQPFLRRRLQNSIAAKAAPDPATRSGPKEPTPPRTPLPRAVQARPEFHPAQPPANTAAPAGSGGFNLRAAPGTLLATTLLAIGALAAVVWRPPGFDVSQGALRPRQSESYAALDEIRERLGQRTSDLWVVFSGRSEEELLARFDAARPGLEALRAQGRISEFEIPEGLWPRPAAWAANRARFQRLASRRAELLEALPAEGFQGGAIEHVDRVLREWERLCRQPGPTAPEDATGRWVREQVAAHDAEGVFALGLVRTPPESSAVDLVRAIESGAGPSVAAGSWDALGPGLRTLAGPRAAWLTAAMTLLVGLSLAATYRNARAVLLSLGVLFFGLLLLWAWMACAGWNWNLMNLLALPLLLGAGVDYAIHQQTALARHRGDLARVRAGTSRALWLGGLTTLMGFGSLAWSTNAGLASLGQVCAAGVCCVLATAQWLLPGWWLAAGSPDAGDTPASSKDASGKHQPSRLYGPRLWALAVRLAAHLPAGLLAGLASTAAALYGRIDRRRFTVVEHNLTPATGSGAPATRAARLLFHEFGRKLADLWRFEAGVMAPGEVGDLRGRDHLESALASGKGVLLVTVHLGNWELGATALARFGRRLLVLTRAEPGDRFTERRQAARAAQGIDTLVVGDSGFGVVEVMRRLGDGGLVAQLIDRPDPGTAVRTTFLGAAFDVSRAPAELARATGCVILPTTLVRIPGGYRAEVLPAIPYDRRNLGSAEARAAFAGEILRAFEPAVRQHPEQWFHFVPVWPVSDEPS